MLKMDHMINRIFYWLTIILVIGLIVVSSFALMDTGGFLPTVSKIKFINNVADTAMGGVQGETIMTQTFKARENIRKIGIKMATYDRENPGDVTVRVFDVESGQTLSTQTVPANQILDNNFNEFELQKVIPGSDRVLAIEVSGTTPNVLQSIGVWCSYENVYPDGQLTVNEFKSDGDMLFYLSGDHTNSLTGPVLISIALALLILVAAVAWMLFSKTENRIEQ